MPHFVYSLIAAWLAFMAPETARTDPLDRLRAQQLTSPQAFQAAGPSRRTDFLHGEQRIEIRVEADIPGPFLEAARGARCDPANLRYRPGELVRIPLYRRGIIFISLPCRAGVVGSDSLFVADESFQQARLVYLPVIGRSGGFGATANPGSLAWAVDTGTLTATTGTDILPSNELRYQYRVADDGVMSVLSGPLVLMRVETRPKEGDENWRVLWSASPWPVDLPQ
jgi:hypothetical protein